MKAGADGPDDGGLGPDSREGSSSEHAPPSALSHIPENFSPRPPPGELSELWDGETPVLPQHGYLTWRRRSARVRHRLSPEFWRYLRNLAAAGDTLVSERRHANATQRSFAWGYRAGAVAAQLSGGVSGSHDIKVLNPEERHACRLAQRNVLGRALPMMSGASLAEASVLAKGRGISYLGPVGAWPGSVPDFATLLAIHDRRRQLVDLRDPFTDAEEDAHFLWLADTCGLMPLSAPLRWPNWLRVLVSVPDLPSEVATTLRKLRQ